MEVGRIKYLGSTILRHKPYATIDAMNTAVLLLALVSAISADGPYHLARPGVNYQQQQPLQQLLQQPLQQAPQQPLQQPPQQPLQQPLQQPMQQPLQQPMQQPLQQPMQRPMQQPMQQALQQQQQQVQFTQQQIGLHNLQPGQIQPNQQVIQYSQQNFAQGYNYQQPIAPMLIQQRPVRPVVPVVVQSFPQHQFTVTQPQPQPQQIAYHQANQLRQQAIVQQVPVQQAPVLNNVQQSRFLGQQIANRYAQQGYNYPLVQIPTGYASQAPVQQINPNTVTGSLQSPDTRVYSSSSSATADPLDETVVDRIQNILAENEVTSANDAGYISLVSGVALEGARPSVEISSFVHNSPLRTNGQANLRSLQELASANPAGNVGSIQGVSNPGNYALPFAGGNGQIVNQNNFLPQTHPTYGTRLIRSL